MKVITGHLTATDKKYMKYLIENKLTGCKVGKTIFQINFNTELNFYTATISKYYTNWCELKPKMNIDKATFIL